MEQRAAELRRERLEREKWKQTQKDELEEMLPKATGREAQLEKKAARREQASVNPPHPRVNPPHPR
eukprot:1133782-Prorocentrum_minimum.AAC.1